MSQHDTVPAAAQDETVYVGDAIRRRAPHVFAVYAETRQTVLESGIVERELKELCSAYLAGDAEVTAQAADPGRYDERQRAALDWGRRDCLGLRSRRRRALAPPA